MVTDDLAAEVAAHQMVDVGTGGICIRCKFDWPCLVRRLADDRDRLRAALALTVRSVGVRNVCAFCDELVVRHSMSCPMRNAEDALSALAPAEAPDAGGERR
jgi:hypothetical protein